MKIIVNTDGASRGNPGLASIGILISDENGKEILKHKKYIGEHTNNFAEYSALVESVKLLKELSVQFDEINFLCDSELVVKQIKGEYKIKNKDMINHSIEFWNLIKSLNIKFSITNISREENKAADTLANEALDEYLENSPDKSLLIN